MNFWPNPSGNTDHISPVPISILTTRVCEIYAAFILIMWFFLVVVCTLAVPLGSLATDEG